MTAQAAKTTATRAAMILPMGRGEAASPAALLHELGELMPDGVAILDEAAGLIFGNAAFRAAMSGCAGWRDGVLRLTDPSHDLRLRAALKRVGETGEAVTLELDAQTLRLTPADMTGFIRLVAISKDGVASGAQLARLQDAFGLTGKEADTALALSEGMPAGAIARERGVSINTVRTQLQMIREKLGVRSSLAAAAEIRALAAMN